MQGVGADIRLLSRRFSSQQWMDEDDEHEEGVETSPSMQEILAKEAADLVVQHKRLSVRDLTSKFEKGQIDAQAAASKLAENARLQEALKLDKQLLISKFKTLLTLLEGRVAGRNKDDVEEAIILLEALSSHILQRDDVQVDQDKLDLQRMAAIFKQASAYAKTMVEEARRVAQAEIEAARATVSRMEDMVAKQERASSEAELKELEDLRTEAQEARRIKMLHEPSKVMDMECKLLALQVQVDQKSAEILRLRKELQNTQGSNEKLYRLNDAECLGTCIQVFDSDGHTPDPYNCSFQWHRISIDGDKKELISGAIKSQYAPEPFDVGRILKVEITLFDGRKEYLSTTGPIEHAPGLGNYVESIAKKGGIELNVVIVQQNGQYLQNQSLHALEIGRTRLKLRRGRSTKLKEAYSSAMQLCGGRGGGEAAPLAMFWLVRPGLTLMLAFQSERERNAAIMLARRFAFDCNVMLAGPDDRSPIGT